MPIPSAPTQTRCLSCGWNTVTRHHSDVIFLPSKCAKCGSDCIEHTIAQGLARFNPITLIQDIFNK